jgi:hypothetical protein
LAQRVLRKHKALQLNEDRAENCTRAYVGVGKNSILFKAARPRHRANLLRATVCFQSTDVLDCDAEKCLKKKLRLVDGQCRFKRALPTEFVSNHHDCRIISRKVNVEKISRDGNPNKKLVENQDLCWKYLTQARRKLEKFDNLIA